MDMSQYLDTFLEEAREHLQKLNENLLALESNPDGSGILDSIFRSAHTLKGMSATMGYNNVAELTHEMENVLHRLRNGEISLNSSMIDLLFKAVDVLDSTVNDIADGGEGIIPPNNIVPNLKRIVNGEDLLENGQSAVEPSSGKAPETEEECFFNEYEQNLVLQAFEQGFKCYYVTIHISPKCVMKAVRAFMVFKAFEQVGEIIKCIPSVQDIEEEKFDTSFEVAIVSKNSKEEINQLLNKITELDDSDIKEITREIINQHFPQGNNCDMEDSSQKEIAAVETAAAVNDISVSTPIKSKETGISTITRIKPTQSVRVDINRLDNLINLVGELVINKTRLVEIGKVAQNSELTETLEQMDRISVELQNVVMKVRMVPIDMVFSRFPRMVRDLAKELDKEINFIIEGKETELDRTVIDEIGDPIVHLLRNSIDHGIELPTERVAAGKPAVGEIILSARHEGNNVIIEVDDDGKGIDVENIRNKILEKQLATEEEIAELDDNEVLMYIFKPGLSTAKKVTDVSGRGVGLDVVKNKIEALGGIIKIESEVGRGTKFKIQLPLTLAIIEALLVQLEEEIYAIPLNFIAETTSIMPEQIYMVQDQEVILLRGDVLPLVRLHEEFQVPPSAIEKEAEINIVVVHTGDKRIGLIVDFLLGQQEIVIKNLGNLLNSIPTVAGATILGNGQVSLIIDVASLF